MSAADWLICPKCKDIAIKYIDSWYGKVSVEEWKALLSYRNAWEDEDEDWEDDKEVKDIIDKIEEKFDNFERDKFSIDESITSLRYDQDTGIGDDCILRMGESYDCEHCGFHIEVNKSWKQGVNQEHKENK